MKDELAELVYPIIKYALDIKDRLQNGEMVNMEETLTELRNRLGTRNWSRQDGENSSLGQSQGAAAFQPGMSLVGRGSAGFLGIRYALVCWLDELFISHTQWGEDWRQHALEVERYRSNDAAFRFWEQAQRAEGQAGTDALEVFYLCVMLGFRGEYRDQPQYLHDWVERVRPMVIRGQGEEPAQADNSEPENHVPVLNGREHFTLMFRWWWGVLSVFFFALVVIVGYALTSK